MTARVLIAGGGTGGHLVPALALAHALAQHAGVEPVLVGTTRGVDAAMLALRSFRYHLLPAEPIHRRAWWRNLRWIWMGWRTLSAARRVLEVESPALVVGTGGYAAGPVVFAAHRRGIPVALQEQNAYPGLTTRWMAPHARQIHLGFPEASRHLRPGPDTAVDSPGNPIVPPPVPRPLRTEARDRLGVPPDRPAVFVTGGSQGARALNRAVEGMVAARLLEGLTLLWSTGEREWERLARLHRPPDILARPFWDPISAAYGASDLVVSRAGALTTAELCAWGLPAILVPLPTAAADHQTHNARALAAAGAARHLAEAALDPASLGHQIAAMIGDEGLLAGMSAKAAARARPDAAAKTASALLALVG